MRTILLLLVLVTSSTIYAQNIKSNKSLVNELRLPLYPLPEDVQTYEKVVTVGPLSSSSNRSSVEGKLRRNMDLPGFELVEGDADLTIELQYDQFKVVNKNFNSERKESKDKEGKVTRWTEYHYTYEYNLPVKLVVINNRTGETLYDKYMQGSIDYKSGSTPIFRSSESLKNAWSSHIGKVAQNYESSLLGAASGVIKSNYGYTRKKKRYDILSVQKHKKFDFSEFNQNVDYILLTLEKIEAEEIFLTSEIENNLKTATEYFEGQLEELDTDNKKSRINSKIGGTILKNLAICYFWMNDFEKAKDSIERAKDLKGNSWMGYMKNLVNDRMKRYEANGLI